MRLVDVIPEADVLCALEPDELGLRILPVLAEWQPRNRLRQSVQLSRAAFLQAVLGLPGRPSISTRSNGPQKLTGQFGRPGLGWKDRRCSSVIHSGRTPFVNSVVEQSNSLRSLIHGGYSARVVSQRTAFIRRSEKMFGRSIIVRNTTPPFSRR